jgi:hydrogenase maturation protein HypF
MNASGESLLIIVKGLIQGVGFRPFIYRIAKQNGLNGWVQNTNENVRIHVEGRRESVRNFLFSLKEEAPPAAHIDEITIADDPFENKEIFRILKSHDLSEEITEISPDIAVCNECLEDISREGNRKDYAFVNCTNCGPRFTIINDLPYDRPRTTMGSFMMCPDCRKEYENIEDRRFHAQPIACKNCGPSYILYKGTEEPDTHITSILATAAKLIDTGGIVAMKGLGGMHLACDAFCDEAVNKLRELKSREGKPFAVMFRDIETLRPFVRINKTEEKSLLSWRRPIVLLRQKNRSGRKSLTIFPGGKRISSLVSSGLNLTGAMLPYMPFHYQLFRNLGSPAIVLTSGNFSDEPIIIDNETALRKFLPVTDAVILHDRDIRNRTDDSVVRVVAGRERVLRRSRGYVPVPVKPGRDVEGIISFGAELVNCFCVGKGDKAILSQHIGDLKGIETTRFYEETLEQFIRLFRIKPSLAVTDLHPDYISTRTGSHFNHLPVLQIQHHHAHIASCMAEHGLDEKVVGVSLDGTGYGTDGKIWGAEFMVCDLAEFRRITHFDYVPLPGGDRAAEEPWRMAVSYLYRSYGASMHDLDLPLFRTVERDKIDILVKMIAQGINSPPASSAGRLFDAVSAILGVCYVANFPAEGPMRLESLAGSGVRDRYEFEMGETLVFDRTIRGIVEDVTKGVRSSVISARFHNTIISAIFETVKKICSEEKTDKVVLSGGVFQNAYLLSGTESILEKNHFKVYSHSAVPANDAGIALGQLAIAAKRREMKCV